MTCISDAFLTLAPSMKYSASLQRALSARRGARKTKARLPGRQFPLTFGKWKQVAPFGKWPDEHKVGAWRSAG